MKSINKIILVFIFLMFVTSFVSAVEVKKTEFVIATEPYQNITAVVKDEAGADLQKFVGRARKFGEYRFTYYGLVPKVKLNVLIINNDTEEVLVSKDFGPYTTGSSTVNVTVMLNPGQGNAIVNTPNPISQNSSNNNGSNSTNVTLANSSVNSNANPLTGRAIGESLHSLPQSVYYVLAGFLGVGLLIFVLRKKMRHITKNAPKEPNHQKMFDKPVVKEPVKEEFKPESNSISIASNKESEAQEIQQKIIDLQKQLEQIRGEEKLIRLQRQISKEKDELKKLQEDKRFIANNRNKDFGNPLN
jgi:hypothetical protein